MQQFEHVFFHTSGIALSHRCRPKYDEPHYGEAPERDGERYQDFRRDVPDMEMLDDQIQSEGVQTDVEKIEGNERRELPTRVAASAVRKRPVLVEQEARRDGTRER